jgi:DNA-binding beta-propeller fold protein YncE
MRHRPYSVLCRRFLTLPLLVTALLVPLGGAIAQQTLSFQTQWEVTSSSAAVLEAVSLAITPNGNLVVPVPGDNAIRLFTAEGKSVVTIRDIATPAGVAVDRNGNLFVVEVGALSFRRYSPTGLQYTLAARGLGRGVFRYPAGIAIDGNGHVFVGDKAQKEVYEFDTSGRLVGKSGVPGVPVALAWHASFGLSAVVASSQGTKLIRVKAPSDFSPTFGGDFPVAIAHDPNGRLLASTLGGRIFTLNASGKVSGPLQMNRPVGLPSALLPVGGSLFVYDVEGFRIVKFAAR